MRERESYRSFNLRKGCGIDRTCYKDFYNYKRRFTSRLKKKKKSLVTATYFESMLLKHTLKFELFVFFGLRKNILGTFNSHDETLNRSKQERI